MHKYFLYARKSTDNEEKQVLSIEAQIAELREFAAKNQLEIVEEVTESMTAKQPGRPVFNQMLARIKNSEADGIISWNPDRLARNAVDGGQIIHLIDQGKIQALKFPTYWFEPSSQGLFMLQIAFGQSKYYIDNLSENVRRGLRQKVRRGEYPGVAPTGYLNERVNHTMVKDPERFHLVKKLYELYAMGKYSLKDLRIWAKENGLVSKSRKRLPLSQSNIQSLLSNPFYYGAFWYSGELHQGTHEPMVSKKLYDKCQQIMKDRSRPRKRKETKDWAFYGLAEMRRVRVRHYRRNAKRTYLLPLY
ncbi:MAG: recombinase family protein [bacterium]|nr:recombinase family protein [bacterium]